MRVYGTRRLNLRKLRDFYEENGSSIIAAKCNYTRAFISQLIGPTPTRTISEKTARHIEEHLRLRVGFLDEVHA